MDKKRGLFEKYCVIRTDGKPIKEGCIVLQWGDENAHVGIKAYSEQVRKEGYTALADNLDRRLEWQEDKKGLEITTHKEK